MKTVPFVWTNDDIGFGKADPLRRQLDLLDRVGIPGVFFVIPRGPQPIDEDAELMGVIKTAMKKGHEFYQHGYIHTAFESGVPATWMLDFAPAVRHAYDERRLEIDAQHTLEKMSEMLEAGQAIWQRAFGQRSAGYRPGWGAICNNLYRALQQAGYEWVSSMIPSRTSWMWNQGQWDDPVRFSEHIPAQPVRLHGLVEYPIAGDYGFRVPQSPEKIDAMTKLGLQEMEYYHTHGWPMLMVSHFHGLEYNNGTGYAVHEKLLPLLLASGKVEPMNLSQLHRKWTPVRWTPSETMIPG